MRNKAGRRKCEMWISNNKVLIGGGMKKPHARNPNFETEETKLLISLWGDPKIQKTLITTHKKHPVIAKLAEKMREHGYHRSPEEINTRIKNLKCFYNRIKKDMEMGVTNEPTWRHYIAMDEILTRPIFGNRVQQPHLQNNNALRLDDAEAKELRPEDLLSVEEEFEDNEVDLDDGSLVPKEEPIDIDEMEDMDEDNEDGANGNENDDVNDIFPKLSAYLQLASNSALKGAPTHAKSNNSNNNTPLLDIKTSPPSSPTEVTKMILATPITTTNSTAAMASTAAASSITTTAATTTSNTSKISLVPTNILMKPATTQSQTSAQPTAQYSFKPQQFLCAKSGSGTQTVYTTTNGGMPMKVLLVNTLQKPTSTATTIPGTITPATAASITTRPIVSIQSKAQQQTTLPVIQSTYQTRSATANASAAANNSKVTGTTLTSNKYLYSTSAASEPTNRRSLQWKYQKATPGFRTLLNQLVQLQNKSLEIGKQRLDVEKQRLEYERSTGDKILNVLTALLQPKTEDTADKE